MGDNLRCDIRGTVFDRGGRVAWRGRWVRAHSLIKQWIQVYKVQASQVAETVKDTGGVSRACTANVSSFACNAGVGVTTVGIVVGTGSDGVLITDFKLQSQVTTNLTHAAVVFALENVGTKSMRLSISRYFTWMGAGILDIKEVGLYNFIVSSFVLCSDRSLYTMNVPSGYYFNFAYRLTINL